MSIPRSWLFVPGDSEKKLAKSDESDADAVILDLEDSVAPAQKTLARKTVLDHLSDRPLLERQSELWVRLNAIDDGCLSDLAAVLQGVPNGVVLPKCNGPADVLRVSHWLDALEVAHTIEHQIRVLPIVTETALGTLRVSEFAGAHLPRLVGLTWGAEDLSTELGASTNRAPDGGWAFTYRLVRSQVLLAAKASGIAAIETLHSDFRDEDGLRTTSLQAAEEGFEGRLAIHPAQVTSINESFAPTAEHVAHAQNVLAAFAEAGEGVASLEGKMLDRPHKTQAQAVLARHEAAKSRKN